MSYKELNKEINELNDKLLLLEEYLNVEYVEEYKEKRFQSITGRILTETKTNKFYKKLTK